ncbi:hypothetical protein BGZ95_011719 [Linnemannia exigua]|uniref:Uncharacterized protein n=1 Tax=Linnemannia exigua TaxID=604196 RepID=A0AAD4DJX2_9FUNG|nr:hypothetical protein BGZ95_011719 [Linnemannia exigua]
MDAITSSTLPLTPSSNTTTTANANTTTSSQTSTSNSTQSTLSKVAAAVVGGVTAVGKRRPSVASIFEASFVVGGSGSSGGATFGASKYRAKPPPAPHSTMHQQHQQHNHGRYHCGSGSEGFGGSGGAGLDAEQLQNHVRFMRSEHSMTELTEYIDRMYHTVMNKDVALEYSHTQISVLHKELDQTRMRSEDDRKALTAEVDMARDQVVKMEENFLLWRSKVHNDQMSYQEEVLQERLVKQDRIEELEDMLHNSQEEVTRLRNRLLVLEYEDGYVGPTAFLSDSPHNHTLLNSPTASSSSSFDHNPTNPSTTITIEHGPMTVDTHKRRSGDFRLMEQRAQGFEAQVQELKRIMEKERLGYCKDLADLRIKMEARYTKLEHDVHAAKMESTMYNEMMHEVVTENDDLRQQVKEAERKMRRQGQCQGHGQGHSGDRARGSFINSNSSTMSIGNSSKTNSSGGSRPRRNQDYYGYPDDGSDDEDDMEDVVF